MLCVKLLNFVKGKFSIMVYLELSDNEISNLVSDKLDQTYVITYASRERICIYSLATGKIEIRVSKDSKHLDYQHKDEINDRK